ncbi:HutD family protein [Microbacterium trichothecenolyticum]|uniref:HutD family protein n=1 Tax=Microbacterium trichothecenolyticum TaxID=69370 RepID=UPI0027D88451|nr:HutD family protein [Microbacterium trichothecenolyticum]
MTGDEPDAWKLSVARLTAPAPFSLFPGVHRTLVPWGGDIRLEIDGRTHDVRHGDAVRFSGQAQTHLVALDRPCHAVNLLASGSEPTLVTVAAGARFDDAAIALVTEASDVAARFDVIRLDPREPLPSIGVVVRFDGD